MTTEEMLELWIDITGVNPQEDRKAWTLHLDGRLSDWDIKKMNDKLMEVVKYDVDGVYTKIFLKKYFDEFLRGKSVTFLNYLDDKELYTNFFTECEKLKLALNEDNTSEKLIIDETHQAMKFYGINYMEISVFDIVDIKISVNVNIDSLNTVQFKRGTGSSQKPKYVRDVYMVSNIDMLIKTIEKQSFDGVSINYIYDSDEPASSYFAFLIKNGQNIFLMSDKPSYAHPNQKYMTRTQGRHMADRIDKTYFPYSLTNLDISKYSVNDDNHNKVLENGYIKLGSIADMEIKEALWIINMFSLIQKKFFDEVYECKKLSYVGGMIQHALLEKNNNALTVYNTFEKLSLPLIEQPDKLELKYEYKSLGVFKNTIERLKDNVDVDSINAIAYSDKNLLEDKSNSSSFRSNYINMLSLNVNDFGTKEEIEYRQKWIARYNFAKQIDRLAKEEYEKLKDKVKEWYINAVWENISNVLNMVIYDKLKGETIIIHEAGCVVTKRVERIVKKLVIKDYESKGYWRGYRLNQSSGWDYTCSFSGKKASIAICIFPNNINDIMLLTGCKGNEIPAVLKDWSPTPKRHNGNCILYNIDPCDWVIKDYWYQFTGQIDIMLSKTVYNNLYKERGLVPDKFWTKY